MSRELFATPPREYGILPFWFLNGELDPDEMLVQLREFRDKGMPGIILHGRYGLETPYIGDVYLDRIKLAVDEAARLGLTTWIYDEMNWPSGTADGRVLRERPDLAQRYIECISMDVRGPWFAYLTGQDSRYVNFERSTPVAAFAISSEGEVLDLTPNLSFTYVIPWEIPPGNWKLMYIVEKRAEYYIDALDPESTSEFLRIGYEPYLDRLGEVDPEQMLGFYTDEPAMHYFLTAQSNPIVPWTKDMFRRFHERCGYDLRRRLPDLFFDVSPDSARVRHDFYNAISDFYADAYYRQIHEWCGERGLLFTGHLLYEEWLRQMIRVEGNLFRHYPHLDVIGVDHLYPIVGTRDLPAEHVAMKVGSSAAHQLGSERLLCESFGGIFMDATMQRMKWVADWEYVLGVNLLNPHGFHYTLEGPRKRDWPPSMFYQYPWWRYYGAFSEYISRLSHLLSEGRHVAKLAVIWPINAMFAAYRPQERTPLGDRIEYDLNAITDLLLRVHHDFDYVDEDLLAQADAQDGALLVGDERHALVVVPPMAHIQMATLERLERFVQEGGAVLGAVLLPAEAFEGDRLVDVRDRVARLFGVEPGRVGRVDPSPGIRFTRIEHGAGRVGFLDTASLARALPERLQAELGQQGIPESPAFVVEPGELDTRYGFRPPAGDAVDITDEVVAERESVRVALADAVAALIEPDVEIDNPEVFALHRVRDRRDLLFLVNSTRHPQVAEVALPGDVTPMHWDPSTGETRPHAPWRHDGRRTRVTVELPPVGSAFVMWEPEPPSEGVRVVATDVAVDSLDGGLLTGHHAGGEATITVEEGGRERELRVPLDPPVEPVELADGWTLAAETPNALVVRAWRARAEDDGTGPEWYAGSDVDEDAGWLEMVPGAWSYQLPTEPDRPYPIPVWYRIHVRIAERPQELRLLVDGFAGLEWRLHVNGAAAVAAPEPSGFDSQMRAVDITGQVREGDNVLALRLVVADATDGLLDLIKLVGPFGVEDGAITAIREDARPAPWTEQGYPFLSGTAVYSRRVDLPGELGAARVVVEADAGDDVLEVLVDGEPAGVRLWEPYGVDITDRLAGRTGFTLGLRVANTAANLLGGTDRPSGLRGAPRLVIRRPVTADLRSTA